MARRFREPWSVGRHDDPVLVDLAVDRRSGHAQRLGRLDLVALMVQQALHDGIALHRLQRAEQSAAYRPALRRQVVGVDRPGPPVLDDLLEDVPELLGVTWPARPQEELHRLGRADQLAGPVELGQEERHELMQVLAVMAGVRHFHVPAEGPRWLGEAPAAWGVPGGHPPGSAEPSLSVMATHNECCLPAASASSSAVVRASSRRILSLSTCLITRSPSPSSNSARTRAGQSGSPASAASSTWKWRVGLRRWCTARIRASL